MLGSWERGSMKLFRRGRSGGDEESAELPRLVSLPTPVAATSVVAARGT